MNMGWPYNPYNPQQFNTYNPNNIMQQSAPAPQMQVPRVNGRNSAEMFAIGPNSSVFLLDESGTILWLVTTDASGYKTIMPYDITPHKDIPAPNYDDIVRRIEQLEAFMNGNTSNIATTQRNEPRRESDGEPTANKATNANGKKF